MADVVARKARERYIVDWGIPLLASELQEYVDYFFTAKTDQLRFAVRHIAMRAIGLAVFLIAAAVAGATAIVLLLLGIVGRPI